MAKHLILAPHHDDAEYGLGIAIQRWIANGDKVRVVVAAGGSYIRADGKTVGGSQRVDETWRAMGILGVTDWQSVLWFQENRALEARYGDLVRAIEKEIGSMEPTDVYVCLPSFNQDHRVLYEAAITAFRPNAITASLHAYEYPGNSWQYPAPQFGRRYHPGTQAEMATKMAALQAHRSQYEGRTTGINSTDARALALVRGGEINKPFAEVTFLLREIVR